ncbi:O-methyltransferase family 2 [Macrophomina phaseolina MS6]|uniref:O-methyltransferase family 2 n=2 Tax=Macrophomina phaseolina TaxID=35725 RepID=K2RVA0_MACPH|nr:O-methyltransferase family 2 [Macrophomina phaseolina MS6]
MLDPELADRVSFVGHDMHEAQTVVADAYLFRHVFPNWPQKYCVKFLKNLVPAMMDGAKVLIHEACLSDAGNVPYLESRFIRNLDICMMSVHSGRERTEGEWEQIFALVDKRFRYCGARKSADGAGFCIYEAVWEADASP